MIKSFFIETFGCQMNKNDSELMRLSLAEQGFVPAADEASADIVVFNTCSVRAHAEQRALSRIRSASAHARGRGGLVVVAGCMAQRLGEDLVSGGAADIVVGPYQSPGVGRLVAEHLDGHGNRVRVSQDMADFSDRINPGLLARGEDAPWHRWVTITHGCENFCAYCIVPYVRGRLISMLSREILSFIAALPEQGVSEITLLGQNVNQYGKDSGDLPFARLLEKAAETPGLVRVNFLTSHPMDFSREIIDVIASHDNISRSIHLPLQSGSDRVLAAMNRKYDMKKYHGIVEALSASLPSHSLSTDLIVGFPGEEREDFEATLEAVREIRFDEAYTYAYSPREGTPAASLRETITREEKLARLSELIEIQRAVSRDRLSERIDQVEDAIVERISKKSPTSVMGRTYLNHPVVLEGSAADIGSRVRVLIKDIKGSTLRGVRIA